MIFFLKYLDNWEGRQVFITGFSTNDRSNGRLQIASLKIDPFSYCLETHDTGNLFLRKDLSLLPNQKFEVLKSLFVQGIKDKTIQTCLSKGKLHV